MNRHSGLTKEQSYNIQIARGIAIFAVVSIHHVPGTGVFIARPFLNFAVGLFLFLSGMLSDPEKLHTGKRILKVLIPYVIWSFVYIVREQFRTPETILPAFGKALLTGTGSGIMYYVFIYVEFTLLIPVIDRLAKSGHRNLGFFIAPLEIVLMRLLPMILGFRLPAVLRQIRHVSCLGWFTYFYLGYLLGSGHLKLRISTEKLFSFWLLSLFLQVLETNLYYLMGNTNSGTQIKLTCLLSGSLFALLMYRMIFSGKAYEILPLKLLGDCSFGIFFAHGAVMMALDHIPGYAKYVVFPADAAVAAFATALLVLAGGRLLGRAGRFLAFPSYPLSLRFRGENGTAPDGDGTVKPE
ncbi:MAG: acyltransferase [Clostridia bacterium]|nr:acyltransferase [Clostridia bacterium]